MQVERFTGFAGWVVWLFVHPYYLIGFETRVQVMLRRSWYYVRYDRPVRSVIRAHPPRTPKSGMQVGETTLHTD